MEYLKILDGESTEDELVMEGYVALYGGQDLSGEWFTAETNFDSDYVHNKSVMIDWEHGVEPDKTKYGRPIIQPGRDDILGRLDTLTMRSDDIGLLARHVLTRRQRYVKEFIEPLARAGLLGSSSEAVPTKVAKEADGKITKWPLKRQSLTVNPMEVRLMTDHQLQIVKSLSDEWPQLKALIGNQEIAEQQGKDGHETQKTLDENGENPMSDDILKEIQESLKALKAGNDELKTENAAMKATLEKIESLPAASKAGVVVVADEADKAVAANPHKLGLFVKAVQLATQRSGELTAEHKAILGNNESVPAEGGFLVATEQVLALEKKMHATAVFSSRAAARSITNGANAVDFYGVAEDSRATGSRFGGVRGYRVAEGQTITESKPTFFKFSLKPEKYAAVVYASDEILNDTALLQQEVMESVPQELGFMLDDDMLNGAAAGYPRGVLTANCLVSVAKETGQAAATFTAQNALKMWSRLWSSSRANAAWFINQDVEPQLAQMSLGVGTGGVLVYMPPGGLSGSQYGSLFGRPVIPTEFNATLGTVGDVVLADWTQYKLASKGSLQVATSIHVQFLTDQTAFRFTARYDGQPSWRAALTPYKGTATLSPFVALATRA